MGQWPMIQAMCHILTCGFMMRDLCLCFPMRKHLMRSRNFCPRIKSFRFRRNRRSGGKKLDISTVGELNDQITSQGIQKILLMQEAIQESQISRIAEQIAQAGNKKFVMIAGPSSSGKTTFSHRLSIQLAAHGLKPHPIAVDNYFVNREHTPLDEFGENGL